LRLTAAADASSSAVRVRLELSPAGERALVVALEPPFPGTVLHHGLELPGSPAWLLLPASCWPPDSRTPRSPRS
jgi:hypothetical protein